MTGFASLRLARTGRGFLPVLPVEESAALGELERAADLFIEARVRNVGSTASQLSSISGRLPLMS